MLNARLKTVLALVILVALGISSRQVRLGWDVWDKHLGDVLYAGAVYLVVSLVARGRSFPDVFAVAFLICVAIELFKLTGIPFALRRFLVARWVLGTSFSLCNLALYLLGVSILCGIDRAFLRKR